jgi:hypothetical protein
LRGAQIAHPDNVDSNRLNVHIPAWTLTFKIHGQLVFRDIAAVVAVVMGRSAALNVYGALLTRGSSDT